MATMIIECVVWCDACSTIERATVESIPKGDIQATVGMVIFEDSYCLQLAQTYSPADSGVGSFANVYSIPKACIIERKKLGKSPPIESETAQNAAMARLYLKGKK